MRLGGRRSTNVEDRRGMGGVAVGGGAGAIILALIAMFFGVDPGSIGAGGGAPPSGAPGQPGGAPPGGTDDAGRAFVEEVLADTEDTWNPLFQQKFGRDYPEPRLVLFDGSVQSACGIAGSAVGPFYCPGDNQVYIDLSFYRDLEQRLGAPGDFAQAYVIAHEVGHHVQNVLGISRQVDAASRGARQEEANRLSVMQELQADCFAGVWAHHAQTQRGRLEEGDIDEALNAAAAIGDDRLQAEAQGHVVPESFTHGTSEQRARWFRRGFQAGDPEQCDTFNADAL